MERNNSKSSGDHFDDDIIETGLFKSAGEVINTGLRLPEEEAIKIQQLKTAITEGVNSCDVDPPFLHVDPLDVFVAGLRS